MEKKKKIVSHYLPYVDDFYYDDDEILPKIYRDKPRLKKEKDKLQEEYTELGYKIMGSKKNETDHFVSNPPKHKPRIRTQDVVDTGFIDEAGNYMRNLQKHKRKLQKEKDKLEHPYGSDNSFIATSNDDDEVDMEEYKNTMEYIKKKEFLKQTQKNKKGKKKRRISSEPTTNDGSINILKPRKKGGRRTRRRRRKRGAVRTKHNTPKAFDLKTMKVIPNPHYKKPKKPSPITLNVQGQQVTFQPREVAQQRKMLTQLKKLSPASSSKSFQLGSFNPQTNKGGRRKKRTKRKRKSRRRMRRKRKRKTRRKRKR